MKIAKDQRVECGAGDRVSAYHELLTLVNPHLLPSTGALAWFVQALPPLGDQPFQTLLADGRDQIREASWQRRRVSYRFAQLWQDPLVKQFPPAIERFCHHFATGQYEHIKDVIERVG
jgi:hypothetical protein